MLTPLEPTKTFEPAPAAPLTGLQKVRPFSKAGLEDLYLRLRTRWLLRMNQLKQGAPNKTNLLAKISSLRQGLQELLKKIEPNFIKLGQKLQSVYANSKSLGQMTVRAAKSIEGAGEESALTRIGSLVQQALNDLRRSQEEISENLGKVGQGANDLSGLHHMCAAIDKTATILHVVGLNIAVESCSSPESRTMFTVFVEEIKQLALKMAAISQNLQADSAKAHSGQLLAHRGISAGLQQLQQLASVAEKSVAEAVDRIHRLMSLSFKGLEKAASITQEISRQVSEIVVAIQFHDITRQQVEHIVDALKDIEKMIEDQHAAGVTHAVRARMPGKAHSILLLQSEQLKTVIQEIENAHQKAEKAFERIGIEILNLVQTLNPDQDRTARAGKTADPFLALQAGMQGLQKLFIQGRDLGTQMEQIADHASQAAFTLTRHIDQVRGISMDLHLKALNAIVKTAHLGNKGKTLEVLAHEVSRLSNEAIRFVDNVVGVLESITSLAANLARHSWSATEIQNHKPEVNKETLSEGLEALTALCSRFKEDSQSVQKYSEDLETSIHQIRLDLDFLSKLSSHLSAHLHTLQDLMAALAPWSVDRQAAQTHEIKNIGRRYTMQKEREIHHALFENNSQGPQPGALPGSDTGQSVQPVQGLTEEPVQEKKRGKEDLGDNVELF